MTRRSAAWKVRPPTIYPAVTDGRAHRIVSCGTFRNPARIVTPGAPPGDQCHFWPGYTPGFFLLDQAHGQWRWSFFDHAAQLRLARVDHIRRAEYMLLGAKFPRR